MRGKFVLTLTSYVSVYQILQHVFKNRNDSFVNEGVGIFPGIIWKDHHEFISGGKDSKLVMHHFKDAVRLCEKVNPISLSVNVNDQLALAINEKLQMSSVQQTGMT